MEEMPYVEEYKDEEYEEQNEEVVEVSEDEPNQEIIEEALSNIITYTDKNNTITNEELYKLGLLGNNNSKELRDKISKHFHIGKCNGKTLIKRLNMLNLSYNDIVEVLK